MSQPTPTTPANRPTTQLRLARPVLFPSRLDAGEDLYFRSPLGRPEPDPSLILVGSAGGLEVAWPWSYLCRLPLLRLQLSALAHRLDLAQGRAVAVVDDGHLDAAQLHAMVDLARRSGAQRVVLVAPALRSRTLRSLQQDHRAHEALESLKIVTLAPPDRADPCSALYPQQPVTPGVAAVLLADLQRSAPTPSKADMTSAAPGGGQLATG